MVYVGELCVEHPLKSVFTLFRLDFPASGHMTASVFSWNSLTPSTNLLARYTILLSHFPLLHPGFTSAMLQSSQERLRWSRGSQLDGDHVLAQLHWTDP
jgi:hypothetical protein